MMIILWCSVVFSLLAFEPVSSLAACKNSNTLLGMKELTEDDKQKLLDIHNKLRELTAAGNAQNDGSQPPAQNMLELTWDEFAAKQAYEWASSCQFQHNDPKDKDNKPMGQNLALRMSTRLSNVNKTFERWMKSMVRDWFREVKLYTFGNGFSSETGHYTQLVWANTAKLGCGYSYYKQIDEDGVTAWYAGYLVCNYSPAGNYIGEDPYIKGSVNCEGHGLDNSEKYPHLCVKKQEN